VEVDAWGIHRFHWQGHAVTLGVPGRHAVSNAMLALAVSQLLGVRPKQAARGLSGVEAASMRAEVRRVGDLTVVVDCYNANPPSVRAALDLLCQHAASRRVAVLGTMLELGEASTELHREILRDALSRGLDLIVATGEFADAAAMGPGDRRILAARDWALAYPQLRPLLAGDEVVLLKASRGVAMEGILSLFEADFGATEGEEA
jgi:UDP-N-acetylmuramoyl-tripeptide--D-alanyl-D-alanine ligase